MKAMVDADLCTGCGLCECTCPEVFEMGIEVAVVKGDSVPAEAEGTCRESMENCPVEAIRIEE